MVPDGEPTLARRTPALGPLEPLELVEFEPAHFELLAGWFASAREVMQWGGDGVRYPLDAAQLQAIVDERCALPPPACRGWPATGARSSATSSSRCCVTSRPPGSRGSRSPPGTADAASDAALVAAALQAAWQIDWVRRADLRVYTFNAPALATYRAVGFVTTHIDPEQPAPSGERWWPAVMALERPADG